MKKTDESSNFQLMKMLGTEIKISLWCELKTISFFKLQSAEIIMPDLARLVNKILNDSRSHIENLTALLYNFSMPAETKDCDFVSKIIQEYYQLRAEETVNEFRDQNLIELLLKIIHYKIVLYGTAQELAKTLGLNEFVELFGEALDNSKNTDHELNEVLASLYITC